jgi:hypothetical protein
MELQAAAAQQGAIGGILHQGMFEGVFRVGRGPVPKDQFGTRRLRKGVVDLLLRHRR